MRCRVNGESEICDPVQRPLLAVRQNGCEMAAAACQALVRGIMQTPAAGVEGHTGNSHATSIQMADEPDLARHIRAVKEVCLASLEGVHAGLSASNVPVVNSMEVRGWNEDRTSKTHAVESESSALVRALQEYCFRLRKTGDAQLANQVMGAYEALLCATTADAAAAVLRYLLPLAADTASSDAAVDAAGEERAAERLLRPVSFLTSDAEDPLSFPSGTAAARLSGMFRQHAAVPASSTKVMSNPQLSSSSLPAALLSPFNISPNSDPGSIDTSGSDDIISSGFALAAHVGAGADLLMPPSFTPALINDYNGSLRPPRTSHDNTSSMPLGRHSESSVHASSLFGPDAANLLAASALDDVDTRIEPHPSSTTTPTDVRQPPPSAAKPPSLPLYRTSILKTPRQRAQESIASSARSQIQFSHLCLTSLAEQQCIGRDLDSGAVSLSSLAAARLDAEENITRCMLLAAHGAGSRIFKLVQPDRSDDRKGVSDAIASSPSLRVDDAALIQAGTFAISGRTVSPGVLLPAYRKACADAAVLGSMFLQAEQSADALVAGLSAEGGASFSPSLAESRSQSAVARDVDAAAGRAVLDCLRGIAGQLLGVVRELERGKLQRRDAQGPAVPPSSSVTTATGRLSVIKAASFLRRWQTLVRTLFDCLHRTRSAATQPAATASDDIGDGSVAAAESSPPSTLLHGPGLLQRIHDVAAFALATDAPTESLGTHHVAPANLAQLRPSAVAMRILQCASHPWLLALCRQTGFPIPPHSGETAQLQSGSGVPPPAALQSSSQHVASGHSDGGAASDPAVIRDLPPFLGRAYFHSNESNNLNSRGSRIGVPSEPLVSALERCADTYSIVLHSCPSLVDAIQHHPSSLRNGVVGLTVPTSDLQMYRSLLKHDRASGLAFQSLRSWCEARHAILLHCAGIVSASTDDGEAQASRCLPIELQFAWLLLDRLLPRATGVPGVNAARALAHSAAVPIGQPSRRCSDSGADTRKAVNDGDDADGASNMAPVAAGRAAPTSTTASLFSSAIQRRAKAVADAREVRAAGAKAEVERAMRREEAKRAEYTRLQGDADEAVARKRQQKEALQREDAVYAAALRMADAAGTSPLKGTTYFEHHQQQQHEYGAAASGANASAQSPPSSTSSRSPNAYEAARLILLRDFGDRIRTLQQAIDRRKTAEVQRAFRRKQQQLMQDGVDAATGPGADNTAPTSAEDVEPSGVTDNGNDDAVLVALEALASLGRSEARQAAALAKHLGLGGGAAASSTSGHGAVDEDGSSASSASIADLDDDDDDDDDDAHLGSASGGGVVRQPPTRRQTLNLFRVLPELESILPPSVVSSIRILQPSGGGFDSAGHLIRGDYEQVISPSKGHSRVSQPAGGHSELTNYSGAVDVSGVSDTSSIGIRVSQPPGGYSRAGHVLSPPTTSSSAFAVVADDEATNVGSPAQHSVRVTHSQSSHGGGASTVESLLYGDGSDNDRNATGMRMVQSPGGSSHLGHVGTVAALAGLGPASGSETCVAGGARGASVPRLGVVPSPMSKLLAGDIDDAEMSVLTSVRVTHPAGGASSIAGVIEQHTTAELDGPTTLISANAAASSSFSGGGGPSTAIEQALYGGAWGLRAREVQPPTAAAVPSLTSSVLVTQPSGGTSTVQDTLYSGWGVQGDDDGGSSRGREATVAAQDGSADANTGGDAGLLGNAAVPDTADAGEHATLASSPKHDGHHRLQRRTSAGIAAMFLGSSEVPHTIADLSQEPEADASAEHESSTRFKVSASAPVIGTPVDLTVPLAVAIDGSIIAPMRPHVTLLDAAGAALLLFHYNLPSHYSALRDWMLMANGHVAASMVDYMCRSGSGLVRHFDARASADARPEPSSIHQLAAVAALVANDCVAQACADTGIAASFDAFVDEARQRIRGRMQSNMTGAANGMQSAGNLTTTITDPALQSEASQQLLNESWAGSGVPAAAMHSHRFAYAAAEVTVAEGAASAPIASWWSARALDACIRPTYDVVASPLQHASEQQRQRMARLYGKTLSDASDTRCDVSVGPHQPSPLSLVLTPASLQRYASVHMFMLRLRRTQVELRTAWLTIMDLRRRMTPKTRGWAATSAEDASTGLAMPLSVHLFRHEASHLLTCLDAYITGQVTQAAYQQLLRDTEVHGNSIHGLRSAHDRYLLTVLARCLLPDPVPEAQVVNVDACALPIIITSPLRLASQLVDSILEVVLQFCCLVQERSQVFEASLRSHGRQQSNKEVVAAAESAPCIFPPESQRRLAQLQSAFRRSLRLLLTGLRGMSQQGAGYSHIDDLLTRLGPYAG